MRSTMIQYNTDLFESVPDPLAPLHTLPISS